MGTCLTWIKCLLLLVFILIYIHAFICSEGYLRLSSEKYVLEDNSIENKFIHLTNNAVQKYSDNYCKYENGN